jgi:prepilin-type processing-associated H-X9-DG protein
METSTYSKTKRSVTVPEVLLIFIIVGVLAGILFPLFASAKERGGPNCLANLKQLGVANLMYAQDNDDTFPPAERWMDKTKVQFSQRQDNLFRCAQDRRAMTKGYGYARNSAVTKSAEAASTTPLLYDSENIAWNAYDKTPLASLSGRHGHSTGMLFWQTSYYRGNIVFADGHAQQLSWDAKRPMKP